MDKKRLAEEVEGVIGGTNRTHPVLTRAGGDFIGRSYAERRPRLLCHGLDRRSPVSQDVAHTLGRYMHRSSLGLVRVRNTPTDLFCV